MPEYTMAFNFSVVDDSAAEEVYAAAMEAITASAKVTWSSLRRREVRLNWTVDEPADLADPPAPAATKRVVAQWAEA